MPIVLRVNVYTNNRIKFKQKKKLEKLKLRRLATYVNNFVPLLCLNPSQKTMYLSFYRFMKFKY